MNLSGVLLKFVMQGDRYTLTLDEMTKEQFNEALKDLNIPIIFVDGNVSQPALRISDNFTRESQDLGNWTGSKPD